MTEEFPEVTHLKWPSVYIHGGSKYNQRTKKKTFCNDFYHINTETGLVRKFFLFDAAKGRASHSIVKASHEEVIYLYGGQGLKDVVFDDLWRFDLENIQWKDQK